MNRSIERQRNIVDFAISSLLRRRSKNLSLLLMYTLIIFVIASIMFFSQALKREAALILEGAPDLIVQNMTAGRQDLIPVGTATRLSGIRGVTAVEPRLWGYYFDAAVGANYTIVVPGKPGFDPGAVAIGNGIARIRKLSRGDVMVLSGYDGSSAMFEVARTLSPESELAAADLILMTEEDFRSFFRFPAGQATDLAVTVGNPRETGTVARKIAEQLPGSRPILKSELLRTYDSIFDWRSGMMIVMVAAAVLSFAIFAWDKATGLSAEERREIGILKSIGWETADVLLLKFWEGAVISLSAFFFGVILAYGHVFFFSASLFEHALKGWAILYPQFSLKPALDAYQLAVLFFLTVVPYTVATIIPSWRAATVDPDAAMRG